MNGTEAGLPLDERIDIQFKNLEAGLADLGGKVERVWTQRRADKRAALEENEARHREVMTAIQKVNGTVRDHGERLHGIDTRCSIYHAGSRADPTVASPGSRGDPTAASPGKPPMDPVTKMAVQAGGAAGSTVAALWIVYQIIAAIIEAARAGAIA